MLPPGPVLQRGQRQGARREQVGAAAAKLLGLGRHDRGQSAAAIFRTRRRPTCSTACARRSRCCSREGLDNVFARHQRHAEATRRAVRAWGLEVLVPQSARVLGVAHRGDDARRVTTPTRCARRSSSASTCRSAPGSGKLAGKVFRIGHLGDFNDLTLCGTLSGVEMGLALARGSAREEGVSAALEYLRRAGRTTRRGDAAA